jgi:hypothetical protein
MFNTFFKRTLLRSNKNIRLNEGFLFGLVFPTMFFPLKKDRLVLNPVFLEVLTFSILHPSVPVKHSLPPFVLSANTTKIILGKALSNVLQNQLLHLHCAEKKHDF